MKNDLMFLTIANYSLECINEDTLKSFNMMLQNDNFSQYHNVIKEKIAEYTKEITKNNDVKKCKVKKFKIGAYYKTVNGSVVCVAESDKHRDTKEVIYNCIVIKGGFEPNKKDNYQINFGGIINGNKIWSNYYVDVNGKYINQEKNNSFDMHILTELKVSYEEIDEEKSALDIMK